jgi:hypothetical protein
VRSRHEKPTAADVLTVAAVLSPLFKKRQGIHGEDLCVYARGLIEAYTKKQGLNPKMLADIAYLVLDVKV